MYKCEICGRETKKKIRYGGYILCHKHMHQLHNHRKFLDNVQRTNNDLNDYVIHEDYVVFNVYNQRNEKVGEFIVDRDDFPKVRYHKWRFGHQHIVTGSGKGKIRELSHIILDIPKEKDSETIVDHCDGDGTNNRKRNLRICTQQENVMNKSFMSTNSSSFIGVSFNSKRNKYESEIRKEYVRCHLGRYNTLKEAVYARYIAEGLAFGEFCNEEEHLKKFLYSKDLKKSRKTEISEYIQNKLRDKKLWQ